MLETRTASLPTSRTIATPAPRHLERRFYVGAAVFVILVNVAGFLPSLVDQSRRLGPPTWLVMAHGVLATAWLLLFLIQAVLVAKGRVDLHRRLGRAGPVLVAMLVSVGSLMVVDMARRGYDLSGDIGRTAVAPGSIAPAGDEYVITIFPPLQAFAHFAILTGLGLWFRRRPDVHKRLMVLAFGPLLIPPLIHLSGYLIGRWPSLHGPLSAAIPIVSTALLFSIAIHDKRSRGRIHPVSLWVPILLTIETFGLIALVMPSSIWRRVAMWLVG